MQGSQQPSTQPNPPQRPFVQVFVDQRHESLLDFYCIASQQQALIPSLRCRPPRTPSRLF
jgi:hypothetical protein